MKKRLVSLLLAVVLCMVPVVAFASGDDIYGQVKPKGEVMIAGDVIKAVGNVLGLVRWIGFVVAMVMVMYVGIKYLTAGAGQKAEVKSTMVPMLVGAAMVGLAPTLVSWIWGIFAK